MPVRFVNDRLAASNLSGVPDGLVIRLKQAFQVVRISLSEMPWPIRVPPAEQNRRPRGAHSFSRYID